MPIFVHRSSSRASTSAVAPSARGKPKPQSLSYAWCAVRGPVLLPRREAGPATGAGADGASTGSYQSYQACHSGRSRLTLDASDSLTDECWIGRLRDRLDCLGGISGAEKGLSTRTGDHGLSLTRRVSSNRKYCAGHWTFVNPSEGNGPHILS